MKIGAVYPQIELRGDPEAVRRIGTGVESLGFDYLLTYDHVLGATHEGREPKLTGPYTEKDPFHDPLVMFAHLAALTRRIELVTGILILPQRQTALVARQVADVDLLSGGRVRSVSASAGTTSSTKRSGRTSTLAAGARRSRCSSCASSGASPW
jgi:alkanesulfonate monooxygenase SsuD/methylene tetrahydromethanopterin reductase-like flavin-dependent oxidoreductase (luciferase family)